MSNFCRDDVDVMLRRCRDASEVYGVAAARAALARRRAAALAVRALRQGEPHTSITNTNTH